MVKLSTIFLVVAAALIAVESVAAEAAPGQNSELIPYPPEAAIAKRGLLPRRPAPRRRPPARKAPKKKPSRRKPGKKPRKKKAGRPKNGAIATILREHNARRKSHHAPPLKWNPRLA